MTFERAHCRLRRKARLPRQKPQPRGMEQQAVWRTCKKSLRSRALNDLNPDMDLLKASRKL